MFEINDCYVCFIHKIKHCNEVTFCELKILVFSTSYVYVLYINNMNNFSLPNIDINILSILHVKNCLYEI